MLLGVVVVVVVRAALARENLRVLERFQDTQPDIIAARRMSAELAHGQ